MIKRFVTAAAVMIGLCSYGIAQETVTGAPAGTAPVTAEPPMHHHHHHYHHHYYHHHMHHEMAPSAGAPAGAAPAANPQ